jgi:quercetin dioxygenase-like cupin family protein
MKQIALALIGAVALCATARAQEQKPEPLKRTMLQKADFPTDKYATISTMVVVQPGAPIGRHTHPGIESGYVVEGALKLKIGDGPEQDLKAGDSFLVPEGVPHGGSNGPQVAKLISTYVVERTKPLASPAP